MTYETILIERDTRGVARLVLNRADRHNAMNATMIAEINAAAIELAADDAVRAVVLTGAGDSFCAGGDLEWMQGRMTADAATHAAATHAADAGRLAAALGALNALPKPVIGRIQGQAFGGGIGLLSVCDVAVGVRGARFGLTETRLGLIPATIGPFVLARMGEAMARRVFMSARLFDADEAVTLGLLARAVPAEMLDAAVEAEVQPYLSCAPGAVAAAKALALRFGAAPGAQDIAHAISALVACWEGDEAEEGIAAFRDKRKPSWMA